MKLKYLLGLVIIASTLSACGASDTDTKSADGLTKVTIGIVPVPEAAPVYLAIQKGIFEEHGLEVETRMVSNGPAGVALALNGELQFGVSAAMGIITAVSNGAPVLMAAGQNQELSPEETTSQALVVKPGSTIAEASDLEGRVVSVNSLNGYDQLAIVNWMTNEGADPSAVEFVEVPYTESVSAVSGGRVDAALATEPFLSTGVADGQVESIGAPTLPEGATVGAYYVSKQFAASDPDLVEAFYDALVEASEYANAHQDETRAVIPEYTELSEDDAANVGLPEFKAEVDADALSLTIDLMNEFSFLENPVTSGTVLWTPGQ